MIENSFLGKEWTFYGRWKEKPLTVSYWLAMIKSKEDRYKQYNPLINEYLFVDGNYYIPDKQVKEINIFTKKIISSNPSFFKKLFEDAGSFFRKYEELCSIKADENGLLRFLDVNIEFFFFWNIFSSLNVGITDYFNESFKDIDYINYIKITRDTILTKEKKEFEKLCILFKNKYDDFKNVFNNYFKKYEFLGTHAFLGKPQTKESIIERLKSLKIKKQKQDQIIQDEFYSSHREILELASEVSYYKMYVAELFAKISYYFWPVINSIAEKYSLDFDKITHYTYQELKDLIQNKKLVENNLIEQRQKAYGIIRENSKIMFLSIDEIKRLSNLLSVNLENNYLIKGSVAFKGHVKGVAKVILEHRELSKIKKGDILVSYETTPDFVPAMEKAAAIVTEMGGITSHAAIVSREMRKPCIVGIKNITKILKDGELVEVDADNGVVKVLKRK